MASATRSAGDRLGSGCHRHPSRYVPVLVNREISLVSLTGGVSSYVAGIGVNGVRAEMHLIPTPLRVSTPEFAQILSKEPYVRNMLSMALTARVAIVGIGATSRSATLIHDGYCTSAEIHLFVRKGAVGDILGHFYDRDGQILSLDLHEHVVGVRPEELKRIPSIVGAAAGVEKIEPILGALRGKLINTLVTDETTAAEILGEDELNDSLLVIDAGTGSVRAVVFDMKGQQLGVGQEEWTHVAEPNVPGSMSFDTGVNWRRVIRCVARALTESGVSGQQIRAVSSTSMREGIVLYDGAGKEVWACANVDSRAEAEVRELKAQAEGLEREFYEASGQTFALGALPRLNWVRKHRPHIYAQARTLSMLNDWVTARLSGEIVVEPTNGGTSGLLVFPNPRLVRSSDRAARVLTAASFLASSSPAQSLARSPPPPRAKWGSAPARRAAATRNSAPSASASCVKATPPCLAARSGNRSSISPPTAWIRRCACASILPPFATSTRRSASASSSALRRAGFVTRSVGRKSVWRRRAVATPTT